MIHGLFYALDNTIVVGLLYGATTLAELNLVGATYTVLLFIACMYDWIGSLCVAIVLSTVQRKMATANKNTTRSMSMFKLAAAACTVTVALANAIHMIRTISTTTAASVSLLQSLSFPTIEASHTWVEAVDNICAVWLRLVYSLWNKMLASGTAPRDHTYEPSLGIRWYLDAQMIPEYRSYFDTLFIIQPVMSACLLRQHVAQENPTIAVSISTSATHYCLRLSSCMFSHHDILRSVWLPMFAGAIVLTAWITCHYPLNSYSFALSYLRLTWRLQLRCYSEGTYAWWM